MNTAANTQHTAPLHPAIAVLPSKRFSRDEMNLAEFPLTVLSTRSDPNVKTLEFQDTVTNKNGEVVKRKWVITGADKFGLPTASDDEVLLGLLKLSVDDGFTSRKIFFTRYELLKILRWTTEGRSYGRLQNALDRLSGVRIKAANAFYDNEAKSHSTRNFGIIDGYEINDGRDNPKPSFFMWSEEIFRSFQVGFIKKLDLDFYLGLKSAVTKRLYRYLDKHFWYKAKVQMNLFVLAHEKIGISRNYQYASSIRQQLDPAIEELIERGMLGRCEYVGKGKNSEIVLYAAKGAARALQTGAEAQPPAALFPQSGAPAAAVYGDDAALLRTRLSAALVQRGLQERQVNRLLAGLSPALLGKVGKIIEHYDRLLAAKSHLISRSPVGFLYRAVQHPEAYVLPAEHKSGAVAGGLDNVQARRRSVQNSLEAAYLAERTNEIEIKRAGMEPSLLQKIRGEVEASLGKLRGLISSEHFGEAVSHGVDEKIGTLFALPSFDEWKNRRRP
jgi:plasmid replication initiation protein